ncbi:hypothetical protein ACOMHN_021037 [Nucella lapillus]
MMRGSVVTDYDVEYEHGDDDIISALTVDKLRPLLACLPNVDKSYINETLESQCRQAQEKVERVKQYPCDVCPVAWRCETADGDGAETKTVPECVSPCKAACEGGHDCFVDKDRKPRCQCKSDDKYAYGGERCQVKTEKLKLSSTKIIAIACGAGGGLVFILIIALIVTCCRQRRRSGKMRGFDDRKSEEEVAVASFTRRDTGLPTDPTDRSVHRPEGSRPDETKPSRQIHYGEDGRMYRVVKDSQLYKNTEQGSLAFRNQAYDSFPEETSLSTPGVTKPAYHHRGSKDHAYTDMNNGTSQSEEWQYAGQSHHVGPKALTRQHVYSDIGEDTFVYQPSEDIPRTAFASLTHINPVAAADPNELSGFPRRDDVRRQDDVKRESYRREDHPGAPVKVFPDREVKTYLSKEPDYPGREPAFLAMEADYPGVYRGSREPGYPGREREGPAYPKPSRAVMPGEPHEAQNPLIHDFSERGGRLQQQEDPGKRGPADRARVYDYVPQEGKLAILRPAFANRPVVS